MGVGPGHALFDLGGEAADEIDIDGVRRTVERRGDLQHVVGVAAAGDQRHRRHGDAVVDDRQPVFLGNLGADTAQIARDLLHLVVDVAA